MCGFAGLYIIDQSLATASLPVRLERMSAAIAHRGPDEQSSLVLPFAAVGFRRLSIVDLQTGGQPVHSRDGRIAVFFNGEIYNHEELRGRLRRDHGIDVRGGSDAAVLPHLYEQLGDDFVQALNGMFAICVLDSRDRSVRLYRDRLGIKPLYVAVTERAVVFGSELSPLWASGLVAPAVAADQVVPYLELFYAPGRRTLARGIERVMPGERVVVDERGVRRERYWSIAERREVRSDDALDELDALLADATRAQLMADVPVGVSLSGGIDSSLLLHYMQRTGAAGGDSPVRAYTITFPDTDPAEAHSARAVARVLGVEQVELRAEPGDFLADVDLAATNNDEPVADPAFGPALRVARAAGAHVKVLLSGCGADELFAGYGHHTLTRRARAYRLLSMACGEPAAAALLGMRARPEQRAALRGYGQSRLPWHARAMTHLRGADRAALAGVAAADHLAELTAEFAAAGWMDGRNQQLAVDASTYLPHQLLAMLDRTTMAVGVEGRVPFLDHRVVELAMSTPGHVKYGGRQGNKRLLRLLAERHLPREIARRPKLGFPNMVAAGLSARAWPEVRDRIMGPSALSPTVLPAAWLDGLSRDPGSIRANAMTVHSLLVLEAWHRRFIAGAAAPFVEPAVVLQPAASPGPGTIESPPQPERGPVAP